jgi:hypothetical protein
MIKVPLAVILGIAFLSLTASAQIRRPDLSKYFNPAALSGFTIPADIRAPKVTEPRFVNVVAQDGNPEFLTSLSQVNEGVAMLGGEVVRALFGEGAFSGDKLKANLNAKDKGTTKSRVFYTTNLRGKTEIILDAYDKPAYELLTYLVSPEGTLVAATRTKKVDGKFIVVKLSNDNVQEDFKAELAFWKDYYLTRIKVAKST